MPVVPVALVVPEAVRDITARVVSIVLAPTIGIQPRALNLSPTITVAQNTNPVTPSASADSVVAGTTSPAKADPTPVMTVTMNIGTQGSTLQIINGGVKLPGNMVNAIE